MLYLVHSEVDCLCKSNKSIETLSRLITIKGERSIEDRNRFELIEFEQDNLVSFHERSKIFTLSLLLVKIR